MYIHILPAVFNTQNHTGLMTTAAIRPSREVEQLPKRNEYTFRVKYSELPDAKMYHTSRVNQELTCMQLHVLERYQFPVGLPVRKGGGDGCRHNER